MSRAKLTKHQTLRISTSSTHHKRKELHSVFHLLTISSHSLCSKMGNREGHTDIARACAPRSPKDMRVPFATNKVKEGLRSKDRVYTLSSFDIAFQSDSGLGKVRSG